MVYPLYTTHYSLFFFECTISLKVGVLINWQLSIYNAGCPSILLQYDVTVPKYLSVSIIWLVCVIYHFMVVILNKAAHSYGTNPGLLNTLSSKCLVHGRKPLGLDLCFELWNSGVESINMWWFLKTWWKSLWPKSGSQKNDGKSDLGQSCGFVSMTYSDRSNVRKRQ